MQPKPARAPNEATGPDQPAEIDLRLAFTALPFVATHGNLVETNPLPVPSLKDGVQRHATPCNAMQPDATFEHRAPNEPKLPRVPPIGEPI